MQQTSELVAELAETIEQHEFEKAIKKKPAAPAEEKHPVDDLLKQTLEDIQKLLQDIKEEKPSVINIPPDVPLWQDKGRPIWPDLQKWQPPLPIYCGVMEVPCDTKAEPGCEVHGSVINLEDTVLQQSDSLKEYLKSTGIVITPKGEIKKKK